MEGRDNSKVLARRVWIDRLPSITLLASFFSSALE